MTEKIMLNTIARTDKTLEPTHSRNNVILKGQSRLFTDMLSFATFMSSSRDVLILSNQLLKCLYKKVLINQKTYWRNQCHKQPTKLKSLARMLLIN